MTVRMDPQQIIDSLDDCYFDNLGEYNCEESIYDNCDSKIYNSFRHGATKMVLFFAEDPERVVKIPFSHQEVETLEGDYELYEFEGAPYYEHSNGWNYCASEVRLYELAKMSGIEKYFLKNDFLGKIKGHPIYTQPFASPLSEEGYRYQKVPREERQDIIYECEEKGIYCFNAVWIKDFILAYGIDELIKLDEFLKDCGLEDLHDGNLGYFEGKPIIIDYGGYYDY